MARLGGLLCVLWLAGCAGMGRTPEPEAPRVTATPGPSASIEPAATLSVPPPASPPAEAPAAASRSAPPPGSTADSPPPAAAPRATVAAAPATPAAAPARTAAPVATKPPAPTPKTPAPASPAPAIERASAPVATVAPPKSQGPVVAPAKQATVAKPAAPPPLDLKSLETRLRETKAIGVFTKLTVKNQVDDLLERFRAFYKGRLRTTLAELRQAYDRLVLKVLALLQDADPPLASDLAASRESIWGVLANPEKFSTLQ